MSRYIPTLLFCLVFTACFALTYAPWNTPWLHAAYFIAGNMALFGLAQIFTQSEKLAALERERRARDVAEAQGQLLELVNQRLEEAQEADEFRARVMESATNAIFALDKNGHFTLLNRRAEKITGYDKETLKYIPLERLIAAKNLRRLRAAVGSVLAGRGVQRLEVLPLRRRNGEKAYVSLKLSPLLSADDSVKGVVGTAEDITEKQQLQQFRADLTRMLIHDLRSPMAVMEMTAQALVDDPDLPPELAREMMEGMLRNVRGGLALVNNILDVSKLEEGKLPVQQETVLLDQSVGAILQELSPLAQERDLTLVYEPAAEPTAALADTRLVERVLRNLVGNAIKFTPPGGQVRVSVERNDGELRVAVSDTGQGIPESLRPRLFRKFVAGTGERSGSGLGLAFCRLAVEAMGGHIHVSSKTGQGSTFAFTLPSSTQRTTAPIAAA